ncbi:MAG TPA: amino acid--tRNA ligase-related protein, partial [Polyangiaceae bacterium]|nr:amino acid--tRNA ligase-related protein [Polyangiaceae bacterium]
MAQQGSSLWLADAWLSVHVECAGADPIAPGSLVELAVTPHGTTGYVAERIEAVHRHERPPSEFERLRSGDRAGALRARHKASWAVRSYFEEQGFIEVQTPTFVPCPGLDAHVHSLAPVVRGSRIDHLITSPELHMKRLLVAGMPRIYQLARVFRAEELGPRHEPEFTL